MQRKRRIKRRAAATASASAVAVGLALFAARPQSADAGELKILSASGDGEVRQRSTGAFEVDSGVPPHALRVGFQTNFGAIQQPSGGITAVWLFPLPKLTGGRAVHSADFVTTLLEEPAFNNYVSPRFNADLYALGYAGANAVQSDATWFFTGQDRSGAAGVGAGQTVQKIYDNFFTDVYAPKPDAWETVNGGDDGRGPGTLRKARVYGLDPSADHPASADGGDAKARLLQYVQAIYANPDFPNDGQQFLILQLNPDRTSAEANPQGPAFYSSDVSRFRVTAGVDAVGAVAPTNADYTVDYVTAQPTSLTLGLSGLDLTWTGAGGNAWDTTAANWSGSPDGRFAQGDRVSFTGAGAGNIVIPVGGVFPDAVTVNTSADYTFTGGGVTGAPAFMGNLATGGVAQSSTATLTKSGSAALILDNAGNNFTGQTTVNAGTLRVTSNSNIASNLIINNATLQLYAADVSVGAIEGAGSTTVGDGVQAAVLKTGHVRQSSLVVAAGATVVLSANGQADGVSKVTALDLAGKLDLNDNHLVVAAPDAVVAVSALIQSGRGNGTWNGATGIVTSQTQATNGSNYASIGVATAAQVKGIAATATTMWAGQTVGGSDTLVMYTYAGDANLDGLINIDDYGHIDTSVGLGLSGWINGDFNYDGIINIDDYGIIDVNIGTQDAPFFADSGLAGAVATVPEPASLAGTIAALIAATARLGRRRGRVTDGY